jgi:hypothetical protein
MQKSTVVFLKQNVIKKREKEEMKKKNSPLHPLKKKKKKKKKTRKPPPPLPRAREEKSEFFEACKEAFRQECLKLVGKNTCIVNQARSLVK